MAVVATAFSAFAGKFAATALGKFLTNTIVGRLLSSVALSALKAALVGKPKVEQSGLRKQQTSTGGITAASFVMGMYATGGQLLAPPMSHGEGNGVPNAYLTYVIELGDIPGQTLEGLILDGEKVEIGAAQLSDYGNPVQGRFQGKAWVKYHDGSQTTADPMLLDKYGDDPDRPWQADMIGTGLCYAIVTFLFDREVYSSFPSVRFEVGGIPLYDPRKDSTVGGLGTHRWADRSTWESSENPGVQAYNVMRGIDFGGGNIWGGLTDAEDLPLAVWWAAMNKADAAVSDGLSGTEAQFRSSYEVFAEDEPASVLEDLLRGCAGTMAENGGVWKIRLGGPSLPVYFFTDEAQLISEDATYTPFSDATEPMNGVQASYPDPDALWEPRDAPALYDAVFEAEDGERSVGNLTLNAAPYGAQVQRVMQSYLKAERRYRRHDLALPPDAVALEPLDVVSWTSDRHNYAAKQFEVRSSTDPLLTGAPRFGLLEVDPDDYDPTGFVMQPLGDVPTSRTSAPAQDVPGFAVQPATVDDVTGAAKLPALRLLWDPDLPDVRGIRWEVRIPNGPTVSQGTTQAVFAGEQLITEGLLPGSAFETRAKLVADRATSWSDWITTTTPNARLGIADLASGVQGNMLLNTGFDHPSNPLLGTLYLGTGTVGNQSTVGLRAAPQAYTNGVDNTVQIFQNGAATTGSGRLSFTVLDDDQGASYYPRIEPEQWYDFSANIALLRCRGRLVLEWYDRDRNYISQDIGATFDPVAVSSPQPHTWPRPHVLAQAPANAAYGRAYFEKFGTQSGSNSYLIAFHPMLALSHQGAIAPTPFVPNRTAYFDGGLFVRGSVSAEALNTASLRVAGMGLFGSLQSDNFDGVIVDDVITDMGTTGFALTRTGNAVLSNLITRQSLVDGSVSDGAEQSLTDPVVRAANSYVFSSNLSPGAILTGQFWHISTYAEIRRLGVIAQSGLEGDGVAFTDYTIKEMRLLLQFRGYRDGGWQPWEDIWLSDWKTGEAYEAVKTVEHVQGNFSATNARLQVQQRTLYAQRVTGVSEDYETDITNLRNTSILMKAVVK